AAHNRDDSPMLYAVIRLTDVLNSASVASLVFAAAAALLSLLALALPFRPRLAAPVALVVAVAAAGVMSYGASATDHYMSTQTRASTVLFTGAREVARSAQFALWRPTGTPRLRLLVAGRYGDGWLSGTGGIGLWPRHGERLHGRLVFTLTLANGMRPTTLVF